MILFYKVPEGINEQAALGAPQPQTSLAAQKHIYIFLDTSVLFSYINEEDQHHISVESAIGAIKPYKPHICIPSVVLLEVMGKLIREKRLSVNNAEKLLKSKMKDFDTRFENRNMNYQYILGQYKKYAKTSFKNLKGMDFYIFSEAASLGGFLLTCDKEMKEKAKGLKEKIFVLASGSSELIKLIKKLQSV